MYEDGRERVVIDTLQFSIQPMGAFAARQYYLESTNILCTEFQGEDGAFKVTDFAPRFYQYDRYFRPMMLVRKIEPIRGQPRITVRCVPWAATDEFRRRLCWAATISDT